MKTSISSLVVGDVIKAEGFTGRVLACQHYEGFAAVTVEFIEGDKETFNYLSGWTNTCQLQGTDAGYKVELLHMEFVAE